MKYFFVILLSVFLSIIIFGCSDGGRNNEGRKTTMKTRDINEVKEDHTKELMAIHGVVGVYIGAQDDGTKCIGVMVDTLTPEIEKKIPKMFEGHPVRVEETGVIKPMK
jgi:hypothetical protein